MATTTTLWASGTPTTTQSTWASTTNATGTANSTYATFTNATSGTAGTITLSGYGAQTAIGAQPGSIDSVTVTVSSYVSATARWTSLTAQLMDGSTALGTAKTLTLNTANTAQAVVFTGITWANLASLGVKITATHAGTTSGVAYIDAASVQVAYTPPAYLTLAGVSFNAPVVANPPYLTLAGVSVSAPAAQQQVTGGLTLAGLSVSAPTGTQQAGGTSGGVLTFAGVTVNVPLTNAQTMKVVAGVPVPVRLAKVSGGTSTPLLRRKRVTSGHGTPQTAVATSVATAPAADDNTIFANPERGLTQTQESHWTSATNADGRFVVLNDSGIASRWSSFKAAGGSLIFRMYYLDLLNTDGSTVPQAWKDLFAQDMAWLRSNGIKMVARFAYQNGGTGGASGPPFNDSPSVSTVLSHVDAMAPLIDAASDVVWIWQQGFFGLWGEETYTDHFTATPAQERVLTGQNWADRDAVLRRMIDGTATGKPFLAARHLTNHMLTLAKPRRDPHAWRVGNHNDAIAGGTDMTDYQTYGGGLWSDMTTAQARAYARELVRTAPAGGESATDMAVTETAMDRECTHMQYSYYNGEQLSANFSTAFVDSLRRRLGYRLTATAVRYSAMKPSTTARVEVDIANTGYARPASKRDIVLELVNGSTTITKTLDAADIRALEPGKTTTLWCDVDVPAGYPTTGSWSVRLWMPDPHSGLRNTPAFAIRLANAGVWTSSTGRNAITTIPATA